MHIYSAIDELHGVNFSLSVDFANYIIQRSGQWDVELKIHHTEVAPVSHCIVSLIFENSCYIALCLYNYAMTEEVLPWYISEFSVKLLHINTAWEIMGNIVFVGFKEKYCLKY